MLCTGWLANLLTMLSIHTELTHTLFSLDSTKRKTKRKKEKGKGLLAQSAIQTLSLVSPPELSCVSVCVCACRLIVDQ